MTYNPNGSPRICVVDCGLKYNQLRCLISRGARVDIVPWNHKIQDEQFDGLFLSNGPGDPSMCSVTLDNLKKVLNAPKKKPIFGICLGHQLLSLAAGCKSYKMRYFKINFFFYVICSIDVLFIFFWGDFFVGTEIEVTINQQFTTVPNVAT